MKRSFSNIQERQRHKRLPDVWWVAINGEVRDETYVLADVAKHYKGMKVAVLNAEESGTENPEWTLISWDAEPSGAGSEGGGPELDLLVQRMDTLYEEVSTMHKALSEVVTFLNEMQVLQEAKSTIQERLDQLEAREKDIERSELLLIERLNRLEEEQTALLQKTDNAGSSGDKTKVVKFG